MGQELKLDSLLRYAGEWLLDRRDYSVYYEGSLPGADGFAVSKRNSG